MPSTDVFFLLNRSHLAPVQVTAKREASDSIEVIDQYFRDRGEFSEGWDAINRALEAKEVPQCKIKIMANWEVSHGERAKNNESATLAGALVKQLALHRWEEINKKADTLQRIFLTGRIKYWDEENKVQYPVSKVNGMSEKLSSLLAYLGENPSDARDVLVYPKGTTFSEADREKLVALADRGVEINAVDRLEDLKRYYMPTTHKTTVPEPETREVDPSGTGQQKSGLPRFPLFAWVLFFGLINAIGAWALFENVELSRDDNGLLEDSIGKYRLLYPVERAQ